MKRHTGNQRGFALVYALVVLLMASVAGTALLFMSQRGRGEATDYTKMRSSSLAAVAALKACEAQFQTEPTTTLAILRGYLYESKPWMLGTAPSASPQKKSFWVGADAPQYAAKIVHYDSTTHYIVIEGIGYGSYGGRKKVIGGYMLGGLGQDGLGIGSSHALFLGGQLENCNDIMHIKGDVYLSTQGAGGPDNQHFNNGGKIEGNFKTGATTNYLDFTNPIRVTGNAFVQCGLTPQAPFYVGGNAGFTKGFSNWMNPSPNVLYINGDAYFPQTYNIGFANCVDGNAGGGKTSYYDNTKISSTRFKDFDNYIKIPWTSADSIAKRLGTTTADEKPFGLNLPASWGTGVVQNVSGTITSTALENYWIAHQNAGTLYQGKWLVLQLTGDVITGSGPFTRKAIWLTGNYSLSGNATFYNCSSESNTLIIVNGIGRISGFGPGDNCTFRGLLYCNSTSGTSMNYKFGMNSIWYGAIQHATSAKFNLNTGTADSVRIWYTHPLGQSAVQEIVNTGIILAPGLAAPPNRPVMLKDIKIRPRLQFMQL